MKTDKRKLWLITNYAILNIENIEKVYVEEPHMINRKFRVYASEIEPKKEFGGWSDVLLDQFDTLEEATDFLKEVLEAMVDASKQI